MTIDHECCCRAFHQTSQGPWSCSQAGLLRHKQSWHSGEWPLVPQGLGTRQLLQDVAASHFDSIARDSDVAECDSDRPPCQLTQCQNEIQMQPRVAAARGGASEGMATACLKLRRQQWVLQSDRCSLTPHGGQVAPTIPVLRASVKEVRTSAQCSCLGWMSQFGEGFPPSGLSDEVLSSKTKRCAGWRRGWHWVS